jgi:hypothetical protein|tara:strand:+ start:225 stop:422 length:198 start_codon:yes stop_codon:yes gene_type:complete
MNTKLFFLDFSESIYRNKECFLENEVKITTLSAAALLAIGPKSYKKYFTCNCSATITDSATSSSS